MRTPDEEGLRDKMAQEEVKNTGDVVEKTEVSDIAKTRYVRSLQEEEVALVDFLARRGYGYLWITGFMGLINTLNLSPATVLKEVERQGFVDAPTQGMIRKYLEEGSSKVAIYRRATPGKMRQYIDMNSMSFDLYDSFLALKGMFDDALNDGSIDSDSGVKLGRVMKDIFESLQKAATEDTIKTSGKVQFNIINIVDNIGKLVSEDCKQEVDAVIEKHIKIQHEKGRAIDVDSKVADEEEDKS